MPATGVPARDEPNVFMVVSFVSDGSGIDRAANGELHRAIERAQQEGMMKLFYLTADKGKEGEWDYCFRVRGELSGVMRAFVAKVEQIASGSSRVHVQYDAPCSEGH